MKNKKLVFGLYFQILWASMIQAGSSDCRLCESLITESDQCTILLDESTEQPTWSCPPVFPCGTIISISYKYLLEESLTKIQKMKMCYKFIMNTQNFTRYVDFLTRNDPIFLPYSVIILLQSGVDEDEIYEFSKDQIDIIYYDALHVIQLYQTPSRITIRNVLTGVQSVGSRDMIPHISSVLPNIQLHPLIDSNFSENEINVSFFHLVPHVIDKRTDNKDTLITTTTLENERFDGFEFQLMSHITRNWKRRYSVPSGGSESTLSNTVLLDVMEYRANMAMSGMWYKDVQNIFDVSIPYAQQCLTLLVPRIQPIPREKYVYMALEENIWFYYGILFVSISCLVCFSVTVGNTYNTPMQFEYFTNTVMQVLAIATQHSISKFPPRISAKVLLIAWFIFSLFLAAIYSTGYTSIVTTTLFEKPINTIKDVVDKNLAWGDTTNTMTKTLAQSKNEDLRQLIGLVIDSQSDDVENLIQTFNYAQVIAILNNRYVLGADRFENVSSEYRVMNTCIFKVHPVFAFKVNSPYTSYFNRQIPKYIESGLIQYWMYLASYHYEPAYVSSFLKHDKEMIQGLRSMTVDDITIGLYVLGGGLIIATVVFLVEFCYFNRKVVYRSTASIEWLW